MPMTTRFTTQKYFFSRISICAGPTAPCCQLSPFMPGVCEEYWLLGGRERRFDCQIVIGDGGVWIIWLFELAIDRSRRDSEELRGEPLVAFGVAQGLVDHAHLDVGERRADLERERPARAGGERRRAAHLARQILDV